jgi:hypothetical protein
MVTPLSGQSPLVTVPGGGGPRPRGPGWPVPRENLERLLYWRWAIRAPAAGRGWSSASTTPTTCPSGCRSHGARSLELLGSGPPCLVTKVRDRTGKSKMTLGSDHAVSKGLSAHGMVVSSSCPPCVILTSAATPSKVNLEGKSRLRLHGGSHVYRDTRGSAACSPDVKAGSFVALGVAALVQPADRTKPRDTGGIPASRALQGHSLRTAFRSADGPSPIGTRFSARSFRWGSSR